MMHRRLTPLLAAVLTAALLHAAPNQAPVPGRDTVTIFVVDPLGNPLPGASIEVTEGDSTLKWKTDDKGKAEFRVSAGEHSAHIEATGFQRSTFRINSIWSTTQVIGLKLGRLTDPHPSPFEVRVSSRIPLGKLNLVMLKGLYADKESQVFISAARTGRITVGDFGGTVVAILVVDGEVRFTGAFDLVHDVGGIELTPEGITPLPRP
ncbi:MAG TPA: carboxypeptidase-like regulatory domain-containing protein, partial [Bryobacteraceae bacterium]|nr:carboxypeptidase-like regulatory domain-containing protein [Bryobacteraceae bacterium]